MRHLLFYISQVVCIFYILYATLDDFNKKHQYY